MRISKEILDILNKGFTHGDKNMVMRQELAKIAEVNTSTISRLLNGSIKNFSDKAWKKIYMDGGVGFWINQECFGKFLKSAIESSDLTRTQIAEKLDLEEGYIEDYEMGFRLPFPSLYERICRTLPDMRLEIDFNSIYSLYPSKKGKANKIPGMRHAMKIHGISKKDFARYAGLSDAALTRYESGGRVLSDEKAEYIAKLLGISKEELFGDFKRKLPVINFQTDRPSPERKISELPPDVQELLYIYYGLSTEGRRKAMRALRDVQGCFLMAHIQIRENLENTSKNTQ